MCVFVLITRGEATKLRQRCVLGTLGVNVTILDQAMFLCCKKNSWKFEEMPSVLIRREPKRMSTAYWYRYCLHLRMLMTDVFAIYLISTIEPPFPNGVVADCSRLHTLSGKETAAFEKRPSTRRLKESRGYQESVHF